MTHETEEYEAWKRRAAGRAILPPLPQQSVIDRETRVARWGAIARDWTAALAQLALFVCFMLICAMLIDALTHTPGPM